MPDPYITALGIASEDIYQTVDDLASKALAAQRISDGERARAGNPRIQSSFPAIRRAELLDLLVLLKAIAERLERMKEDEEREI